MEILVLQGSPNRHGSTALLVEEFCRGAREAGHAVERIDVAYADVAPCTGCVACGYGGTCVQRDGMDALRDKLLAADMIVFATPLYYFNVSGQLKSFIDRFCAFSYSMRSRRRAAAFLAVAWNDDSWTFDALDAYFTTLARYLRLEDRGRVLAGGCGTPAQTAASAWPSKAYELGRSLC